MADFGTRAIKDTVRRVPGVSLIEGPARAGQRYLLSQIRRPLDVAAPRALPLPPPVVVDDPEALPDVEVSALEEQLRGLLRRSVQHTPAESRRVLHEALLSELVPDEARILSALSDGTVYPLIDVSEPGIAGRQERALENASSVGRAAGVALPGRVPVYVSHLRRLGLATSGPEDPALRDEYELLLTDPGLRATIEALGKGPLGARVIRRTLRIGDLGQELWDAAHGSVP